LFIEQEKQNGFMIVGIHVDDCLVWGKEREINQLIADLNSKGFSLKVERNLKDYLRFRGIENIEKQEIVILQSHFIYKLIDNFRNEVSNNRVYGTPGTPRFEATCTDADSDTIHESLQKNYRSSVGILLSLIKYLRPDLNNAMRELLKCMDKATVGT
jgi:hypothetical protein